MKDERVIPSELAGMALDGVVRELWGQSWGKARAWIETGKVSVDGEVRTDPRAPTSPGATIRLDMNAPRPGKGAQGPASARPKEWESGLLREQVVYVDPHLIVVDKPAGISTVPFEGEVRRERSRESRDPGQDQDTLQQRVCAHLRQRSVEVVHRIDKETSGLVVFARNREAARALANQFRFHTVHRRYLALAQGRVGSGTIRSLLIENRGDGLRGSVRPGWRVAPGEGREAITHVQALEELEGATLIECRLETGRTHQIRIHLSEAGHPLLGEKLYIRDFRGALLPAPRVMLHAAELGFEHPSTGARMQWRREPPDDLRQVLETLRQRP